MSEVGSGVAGTTTIFHVDNNLPPTTQLNPFTLSRCADGKIMLQYVVEDPEGDILQLEGEFSRDGGSSWSRAHLSGATMEIEQWLYGEPVYWNIDEDVPDSTDLGVLALRLRATDSDYGPWSVAYPVDQGDSSGCPGASAQVIAPSGESSGMVDLGVRLPDPEGDPLALVYEYSIDGCSTWSPATIAEARPSLTDPYRYNITWDSRQDIGAEDLSGVRFRACSAGERDSLSAMPSSPFRVDNNQAPAAAITSPGAYDFFRGLVPVGFRISDSESDPIRLDLEYRRADSDDWVRAEGVMSHGPWERDEYSSRLDWNSAADLPGVNEAAIYIRILASDTDTTVTRESGPLVLDNDRLPGVVRASLAEMDLSSGTAVVAFELSDPLEGSLDLRVDFSTDNGGSWHTASSSGDLHGLTEYGDYAGTFEWNFGSDVRDQGTALLRLTPIGSGYGAPRLLEVIVP